jgi:hypothetical protein
MPTTKTAFACVKTIPLGPRNGLSPSSVSPLLREGRGAVRAAAIPSSEDQTRYTWLQQTPPSGGTITRVMALATLSTQSSGSIADGGKRRPMNQSAESQPAAGQCKIDRQRNLWLWGRNTLLSTELFGKTDTFLDGLLSIKMSSKYMYLYFSL